MRISSFLGGQFGRTPSGLSQGSLLFPWLLYSIQSLQPNPSIQGLFVVSLNIALWVGLFLLLRSFHNERQMERSIAFFGYTIALSLCFSQLLQILKLQNQSSSAMLQCGLANGIGWSVLTLVFFLGQVHWLSKCFSVGEMLVCAELLSTFCWIVVNSFEILSNSIDLNHLSSKSIVLLGFHWMAGFLFLSISLSLTFRQWISQKRSFFLIPFLHLNVIAFIWTGNLWLSLFHVFMETITSTRRMTLIGFWCLFLIGGIWSAQILKPMTQNIIIRKWFHFIAIGLFLPAHFLDPSFLQLALSAATVVFFIVEALRLSSIPHLSPTIDRFLSPFTDHRDNGPIIFSHFSLLLGLALPIWIYPLTPKDSQLLPMSGLIGLGIGDSFAAIIGTW